MLINSTTMSGQVKSPPKNVLLSPRFGIVEVQNSPEHPLMQRPHVPSVREKWNIFKSLLKAGWQMLTSRSTGQFQNAFVSARTALDSIGQIAGFQKPQRLNRLLVADAYTSISERYISQAAKDKSIYHITFRRDMTPWMKTLGLTPDKSRFVFFGIQQKIQELLKDPITQEEVDAADRFFNTARGNQRFDWDRRVWDRVVKEKNGIIPIKIEALPDGSVNFPGEPCIQITAQDGYGELAAWFETKLVQTWATSERASMLRHWLDYNKNLVRRCTTEPLTEAQVTKKAQSLLADFSDRSSRTQQESEMLGLATLTSHPTTATVQAAHRAFLDSGGNPGAYSLSMYSLAHRVVQSFKDEKNAYETLYVFSKNSQNPAGKIASYVADCYDFERAVTQYLVPIALRAAKENPDVIICARPDSGDAYQSIKFVLDEAVKAGLYKEVKTPDGKTLKAMTNLRVIQADGVNFGKIMELNERLIADGYSPPDSVYYGVGGYLADEPKRSSMSAAQKLAAMGTDDEPVMKSPKTEQAKASIPGAVKIVRSDDGAPSVRTLDEPGKNEYVTYYDGINNQGITLVEDFRRVQQRTLEDFWTVPCPASLYSQAINAERDRLSALYHGTFIPA